MASIASRTKSAAPCPDRVAEIGRELAKVIAERDASDDERVACLKRGDEDAATQARFRNDRASDRQTDLEDAILVPQASSLEGALRQLLVAKSVANAVMEDAPDQETNQRRVGVALRSVIEVLRREVGLPDNDAAGENYAPVSINPFRIAGDRGLKG
jgi:hypothetical protein